MTAPVAPSNLPVVAYLTDVEGLWPKLESFVQGNPWVSLDHEGRLRVAPGAFFVFGGDAIDRGAHGRRIVAALLDVKLRQPDQVILLAGNRDINKLRLLRELSGFPPQRTPDEIRRAPRPELLRWILSNTMGAALAFEGRQRELVDGGGDGDGEAVVESFLADLTPQGDLTRYLACCQLAFRCGLNLFVHGSVTPENLGRVPGLPSPVDGVDAWVDALNRWYHQQIDAYLDPPASLQGDPPWSPLVAYQAPLPGTKLNQTSVVYARPTDDAGNPALPPRAVVEDLRRDGIHRVIVGHSPVGDCPALLRTEDFEFLLADNSYSPVESGSRVLIRGEQVESEGPSRVGGGERVRIDLRLGESSPVGLRLVEGGHLVKGQLSSGDFLLHRSLPGFRVEHRILPAYELRRLALQEPWGDASGSPP